MVLNIFFLLYFNILYTDWRLFPSSIPHLRLFPLNSFRFAETSSVDVTELSSGNVQETLYPLQLLNLPKPETVDRWQHLRVNWKREPPYLTMARWLGIWPNTNSVVNTSIRQSNRQNVSAETKWSRNSAAQTQDLCGKVYRRTTKGKPDTLTSSSRTN
jgi:hypothetical protein